MPLSITNSISVEFPNGIEIYRIQRKLARTGAIRINNHILAPARASFEHTRFGLKDNIVAYYADREETALYETFFRREQNVSISKETLMKSNMLIFSSTRSLRLIDLRCLSEDYPVLQSLRYDITRDFSQKCFENGYDGIIYKSAQHPNQDCYCLYEKGIKKLKLKERLELIEPNSGAYLNSVYNAANGSCIAIL